MLLATSKISFFSTHSYLQRSMLSWFFSFHRSSQNALISNLEEIFTSINQAFSQDQVLILAIEKKVFFENVVKIMDGLEDLGFLNIKIQTYTHEQSI